MDFILTNNWLLVLNSLFFWLSPVALAIHLAIVKKKPNKYKKKIGYIYGSLWAIAFVVYVVIFFVSS